MAGCIDIKELSVATLRQLLLEADERERHDVERERAQLERERHDIERERAQLERERLKLQQHQNQQESGNGTDPAQGMPVHLRSIARALPPVLSASQAQEVLSISKITLRRWIENGKLTATQHGPHGKVLITRDAVLLLLGSQNGTENEP